MLLVVFRLKSLIGSYHMAIFLFFSDSDCVTTVYSVNPFLLSLLNEFGQKGRFSNSWKPVKHGNPFSQEFLELLYNFQIYRPCLDSSSRTSGKDCFIILHCILHCVLQWHYFVSSNTDPCGRL